MLSHAISTGESMNAFVVRAINEAMERDNIEREGNPPAADQQTTLREPVQQTAKPTRGKQEKHCNPFTEDDARKIDLQELLSNFRYQLDVADAFGTDVLAALLDKAQQQAPGSVGNLMECMPDNSE